MITQPASPTFHRVRTTTAADGVPLTVHQWEPEEPRGAVFYVHGLQSHAGWLFESGPELAARGCAVYAADRRGSGTSGGQRGHLPSAEAVLDDYAAHFDAVRDRCPQGVPVTAVGQSFGGSVLGALLSTGRIAPDAVVLCAPALGQQYRRHGRDGMDRIRERTGLRRSPVTLKDEDYTADHGYLSFMANDHLMLRQTTDGFRAAMVELELLYRESGPWRWHGPQVPVYYARPERDAIIDLDAVAEVLSRLCPQAVEVRFAADHHYLEFSAVRDRFWDWLAGVAVPGAAGREGCL
ncbi:alpha/beta hydrolase [Streptomyces sp. RPT161]|uniref:alpha/beta hydrolase n=1 Tax=Streptomyces sp. RPT161 TaxID=3015993 RepID=UPI0022B9112B|nr:alpha/beta fold hydrolase [Streptomyces sp. RPT161]